MNEKIKIIQLGFLESLPLAIAIAAYGLSYGVLAIQANFSLTEAIAMSLLVFSGSVQMVVVAMLASGASLAGVFFTSILLNLRNLLYGTALAYGLTPAGKWRWILAFGVTDEPFVLGISRFQRYGPDPIFFATVTGTFYAAWLLSSFVGASIGNQIDPQKWGLDLAFPITFTALLIPSLKEKPVIATAITAIMIAFGLEYLMPGSESMIIITGILSPLVGIYFDRMVQNV